MYELYKCLDLSPPGAPRVFLGPGANCKMRHLVSLIEASRRGRELRNLRELNLEALLGPCRLLLLGGSLNTSKEAINDISC